MCIGKHVHMRNIVVCLSTENASQEGGTAYVDEARSHALNLATCLHIWRGTCDLVVHITLLLVYLIMTLHDRIMSSYLGTNYLIGPADEPVSSWHHRFGQMRERYLMLKYNRYDWVNNKRLIQIVRKDKHITFLRNRESKSERTLNIS